MLLAIDVGNTNTVFGVFDGERLKDHWRVQTDVHRTADEYGVLLQQLCALSGLPPRALTAVAVASVVPPLQGALDEMGRRMLGVRPLFVGPGVKTGVPILCDNPREVGADRIVNAVAAYERFRAGLIVVDFGTATTFDAVSPRGEYLGGVISPGLVVSLDALVGAASKLPRVDLVWPPQVVGKNTIHSMQAGALFGYVAMVDGLCARMKQELSFPARVIATGGLASTIASKSDSIEEVDEFLTLEGLRLIHARTLGT